MNQRLAEDLKAARALLVEPTLPAPVRLSIEECVYWLSVVYATAGLSARANSLAKEAIVPAVLRDRKRVFVVLQLMPLGCNVTDKRARREYAMVTWLCRQAIAAIGRERA